MCNVATAANPAVHNDRPLTDWTATVRPEVPGKNSTIGIRVFGWNSCPVAATSSASRQCAYSSWYRGPSGFRSSFGTIVTAPSINIDQPLSARDVLCMNSFAATGRAPANMPSQNTA